MPVTTRSCQATRTGTVLESGDDLAMTFPWVSETIARARQEEIRTAVAQHHYAEDHCERRIFRVRRRRGLWRHLFGPRVDLRLVPSGPPSRPATPGR